MPLKKNSRKIIKFNALGGSSIELTKQLDSSILKKTYDDIYDDRWRNDSFLSLVSAYEEADDTAKPLHMHPKLLTLYDFLTFFRQDWTLLPQF